MYAVIYIRNYILFLPSTVFLALVKTILLAIVWNNGTFQLSMIFKVMMNQFSSPNELSNVVLNVEGKKLHVSKEVGDFNFLKMVLSMYQAEHLNQMSCMS